MYTTPLSWIIAEVFQAAFVGIACMAAAWCSVSVFRDKAGVKSWDAACVSTGNSSCPCLRTSVGWCLLPHLQDELDSNSLWSRSCIRSMCIAEFSIKTALYYSACTCVSGEVSESWVSSDCFYCRSNSPSLTLIISSSVIQKRKPENKISFLLLTYCVWHFTSWQWKHD